MCFNLKISQSNGYTNYRQSKLKNCLFCNHDQYPAILYARLQGLVMVIIKIEGLNRMINKIIQVLQ